MRLTISIDGQTYSNFAPEELLAFGSTQDQIDEAVAEAEAHELNSYKAEKSAKIAQKYQAVLAAGVTYSGHVFPLTNTIRNSITSEWLRVRQGVPATGQAIWPVIGEAPIALTDAEIDELGPIARNAFVPLNNKYLMLITQVAAAQDKATVDEILWTT